MSSAHIKKLIGFEFSSSSDIHSSLVRCRGRSAKKILNKRGLRIHPCFTPWLATNVFVSPSFNFTQQLSFLYKVFRILKNLPDIPISKSLVKRLSLGILSKSFAKVNETGEYLLSSFVTVQL